MEHKGSIVIIYMLCVVWGAHAAVKCTAAGRFPDTDDPTCQNFTLCVYERTTGTYLSYNYVCLQNLVFHPDLGYCTTSSNYACPKRIITATNCASEGYIADANDANCSSYIECVKIEGEHKETVFTCPENTYFNPKTTLCESDYICPNKKFTCTSAGRFANTADRSCQTYYLCVASKGMFIQFEYTCPSTSVFSPTASVCTTKYTCNN